MFKRIHSLRAALVLLASISILPALGIIYSSGLEVSDRLKDKAVTDVRVLTANLASIQERVTASTRQLLATMAVSREVRDMDTRSVNDLFHRVLTENPSYTNIVLLAPDGRIVASALPYNSTSLADRKHYREAVETGRFSAGEFIISRTSSNPAFPFSMPVLDPEGRVKAVLVAAVELREYEEIFRIEQLPPGSFVSLSDYKGLRLFRQPADSRLYALGGHIAQDAWNTAESSPQDTGVTLSRGSDGVVRLTAFVRLKLGPGDTPYMYLFVGVPESSLTTAANAATIRNLGLMFLAAALAVLFAWSVSRFLIMPPVSRMVEAARRFGSGDFSRLTGVNHRAGEFGLLASALDRLATERAKAESDLKASEERYALAVRGTNDGIWDWDLQTQTVYFSPRYKEILGHLPEEMPNELDEWKRRVHPDDLETVMAANGRCIAGEAPFFEVEYRLLHADGTYRWVLGRGACLKDDTGKVIRLAGAHTDISERKRLMEHMIQSEKMLSVGGLAAGMAHEINNPLSGILQSSQVILNRLGPENQPSREAAQAVGCDLDRIRSFLERRGFFIMMNGIRESAGRAALIVSTMLDFSRRSDDSLSPQDLETLLDKAVDLCSTDYDLKSKFDFRKIAITREYDPTLPAVNCSEVQIQQVFVNILGNAAHALEGREDAAIILRTRQEDRWAVVEIEDNGPGLDDDAAKHIFEPFYTTKSPGHGTGLGLAVSYFIVSDVHGGVIDIVNRPGSGACFIIRIPTAGKPSTADS